MPGASRRAAGLLTPPLVGPAKVGNFTVWSFPHTGAMMLLVAAALSVYGVRLKPDATAGALVEGSGGVRLQPDRSGKAAV